MHITQKQEGEFVENSNKIRLREVLPSEIEKRSFEIITDELGDIALDPLQNLSLKG